MKKIFLAISFMAICLVPVLAQIQPDQARTDKFRREGPCSDPWITWAYIDASAGTVGVVGFGNSGECNKMLYNNGSWNNYTDLYNSVRQYRNNMSSAGLNWVKKAQRDGSVAYYVTIDGVKFGSIFKNGYLVGNDGASLIGNDSAGLVGNDGSTLQAMAANSYGLNSTSIKKRIKIGPNTYLVIK